MELLAPAGTMETLWPLWNLERMRFYLGGKGFNARAHAAKLWH